MLETVNAQVVSIERRDTYVKTNDKELAYYDQLHKEKYRDENQTIIDHSATLASNLASDVTHTGKIFDAVVNKRFLAAGRVQAALGATEREVSPFNCSVSQRIDDSMTSIMAAVSSAATILRLGTGIGFNFSNLRPQFAEIKKLKTKSSGPLSFMKIFDVTASTIASAGHRRGAMMGIMNVTHPDIEKFIDAKMEKGVYRQFNLSVGITDEFMSAVMAGTEWPLSFEGQVYKTVNSRYLWNKIIRNAYESAEPGIIFIDRLNDKNNLKYCETIEATNPCSEQPLPPYGLCTLGSFNLVEYLYKDVSGTFKFNYDLYVKDIHTIVEAYDNIFDEAIYAIPEHEVEAKSKRRIGLGLTGIANAIELLVGRPCYGEQEFCEYLKYFCGILQYNAYKASINLAKKRGAFKQYTPEYLNSPFLKTMPIDIREGIENFGIRNSHLISYAPCGTISQTAGNVSSGVEPVFHHQVKRDVHMQNGKIEVTLNDWAYREHGFKGKTLEECSIQDHLNVAEICQHYCDSAVSKTVNVASNCSYEDYEQVYKKAHSIELKGITVYRPTELRGAVIQKADTAEKLPIGSPVMSCANGICER